MKNAAYSHFSESVISNFSFRTKSALESQLYAKCEGSCVWIVPGSALRIGTGQRT